MAAKRPKSVKLDVELLEWSEAYALERGVSWTSVVEAGLRELQASAMGGVPDLGGEAPAQVRRPPSPFRPGPVRAAGPVRVDTVPAARSWAWERQQRLNKAKGL